MIKVKFSIDNKNLKTIEVNGHAYFDIKGNDIVCSAVSSVLYSCLNSFKCLNKNDVELKDGHCKISNLEKLDEHDLTVVEVFKKGIELISNEYPKNVKIIIEEK